MILNHRERFLAEVLCNLQVISCSNRFLFLGLKKACNALVVAKVAMNFIAEY